jgi:hypothetical protein
MINAWYIHRYAKQMKLWTKQRNLSAETEETLPTKLLTCWKFYWGQFRVFWKTKWTRLQMSAEWQAEGELCQHMPGPPRYVTQTMHSILMITTSDKIRVYSYNSQTYQVISVKKLISSMPKQGKTQLLKYEEQVHWFSFSSTYNTSPLMGLALLICYRRINCKPTLLHRILTVHVGTNTVRCYSNVIRHN